MAKGIRHWLADTAMQMCLEGEGGGVTGEVEGQGGEEAGGRGAGDGEAGEVEGQGGGLADEDTTMRLMHECGRLLQHLGRVDEAARVVS